MHGSAPDLAGQDKANPMAMVLSAAMMLRTGLKQTAAADDLEQAVYRVLAADAAQFLTPDGRIIVEIGAGQGPDVVALFEQALWANVGLFKDINGKDRVVCCLLYTSPSPRDRTRSRMPSSA